MFSSQRLSCLVAALALSAAAGTARASLMIDFFPPPIDGADIAMLDMTGANGVGKFWTGEGFGAGQTFTTAGDVPQYQLNGLTIRFKNGGEPTKTYEIRLGQLSDTWDANNRKVITVLETVTEQQSSAVTADQYLIFTFDTPMMLTANTEYSIDIRMTGSTTGWRSGIPTVYKGGDNYDGGEAYKVIWLERWGGDLLEARRESGDWVFHLDMAAVPEPASLSLLAMGGMVAMRRRR